MTKNFQIGFSITPPKPRPIVGNGGAHDSIVVMGEYIIDGASFHRTGWLIALYMDWIFSGFRPTALFAIRATTESVSIQNIFLSEHTKTMLKTLNEKVGYGLAAHVNELKVNNL